MLRKATFLLLVLWGSQAVAQSVTVDKLNIEYIVQPNLQVKVTESKILTIHNENGFSHALFQEWASPHHRINKVQIILFDQSGRRIGFYSKKDLFKMSTSASYERLDSRLLAMAPEHRGFPFTIKTETEKTFKGFISLPTWMPRNDFNMAVSQANLTLSVPKELPIRFKEENIQTAKIRKGDESDVYSWQVRDLPAVSTNADIHKFYDDQPKVFIAPEKFKYDGYDGDLSSWQAFGDWFLQLNLNRNNLTEDTKSFLNKLSRKDKRTAIQDIYAFMQDRTRYISIQLGIGGYQSMPALTVDQDGYGDCKALTNYMKSMLTHIDIPSNYVLVRAGIDEMDVEKDFPSNQFNHVFLGVPMDQDTIYLECTSQSQPFNYLGGFTDDRNVLWVKANDSEIIRTPVYDETFNQEKSVATITIGTDGTGNVEVTKTHEGYFSDFYDAYLNLNQDQLEEYHYSQFNYDDFAIKSTDVKPREKGYPRYERTFELSVNNLAKNTRGRLILPANLLEPIDSYLDVESTDQYAQIKRGFSIIDEVQVKLPSDYYLPNVPENMEFSSDVGSYKFQFERTLEGLKYTREIIIPKGEYREAEFESFHAFYNDIKRNDRRKMIIQSKT